MDVSHGYFCCDKNKNKLTTSFQKQPHYFFVCFCSIIVGPAPHAVMVFMATEDSVWYFVMIHFNCAIFALWAIGISKACVVGEEGYWRSEENTFVESLKMSVCHNIGW